MYTFDCQRLHTNVSRYSYVDIWLISLGNRRAAATLTCKSSAKTSLEYRQAQEPSRDTQNEAHRKVFVFCRSEYIYLLAYRLVRGGGFQSFRSSRPHAILLQADSVTKDAPTAGYYHRYTGGLDA